MSTSDLERFVGDIKNKPGLQSDLKSKGGGPASVVDVARAHGYDVSMEDIRQYAVAHGHELTDEELEQVTGGVSVIVYHNYFVILK
jgi:predicted ribosomally synthesized peptide with nif11-like leader